MVDAHHPGTSVTGKQSGFGLKRCGDDLAVPLCRTDHMIAHSKGKEIQFWLDYGIDPVEWAEKNFSLERVADMYKEYLYGIENLNNEGFYHVNKERDNLDWIKRYYP